MKHASGQLVKKLPAGWRAAECRMQNLYSQVPEVMPKELLLLEGRQQLLALLVWALD